MTSKQARQRHVCLCVYQDSAQLITEGDQVYYVTSYEVEVADDFTAQPRCLVGFLLWPEPFLKKILYLDFSSATKELK
jgi:hypothetical protein